MDEHRSFYLIVGIFSSLILVACGGNGTLSPGKGLPLQVLRHVPFTCQAPAGNWSDPRQQDGCEEACILMAAAALGHADSLSPDFAIGEINRMCEYELNLFGSYQDTGIEDTARLLAVYFDSSGFAQPRTTIVRGQNATVEQMRQDIAAGNILFVPLNGEILDGPFYKSPPLVHMVLVIGYDDETGKFVINDPGTKSGASLAIFSYEWLWGAMEDYITGVHKNQSGDKRDKVYLALQLNPG